MTTKDPGADPDGVEDPRLASLDKRLRDAHHTERERTKGADVPDFGMTGKGASQGNRVLSALIGAPLGSAIIGWLVDRWFDTRPWGLLVMLFLGFIVAVREVWRISKERAE